VVESGGNLVQLCARLVRRQHLSHTQKSTLISTESGRDPLIGSSMAIEPRSRVSRLGGYGLPSRGRAVRA
jgi:hypothetical protein